ncbi:MAG: PepSY-associated TM helix domain-containing protein [Phenylobacterium sp.]|uniref:PepSY-associated TM helix domain-containing protein n=1 Tax=Phenylobacterium sp. TaxID=1871053 RepID=UPI002736F032|nr:PepSY-associated TM helix domain-containing protein [Phenylobacterium sp.]MDP3747273.1 PepSY-associated TM helix domain-containing protein [Phenylobacterium sp.]
MGVLRAVHAWAGALLALQLVVLGLSGSLLVLKDDWLRATLPAARQVVTPTPQALGQASEALERAYRGEIRTLVFARPDLGVHRVYLAREGSAYADGSGGVIATWRGNARLEAWIFDLHHKLLAGEPGKMMVGIIGLAGAVLTLTGLIIWFPSWRAFAWKLWPRSARRRDLVGAHRDTGMIFLVPVFALCLTGGAIIFHEQSQALMTAAFPGGTRPPKPPKAGQGDIDWPRALAAAQARFPDAALRMAAWPAKPGAPATIRLRRAGEWHPNGRTLVYIDPATSQTIGTLDSRALAPGMRAYNAFYPLHAASVGGRGYDLAIFLSGLALAGLGGVGFWSFLVKPRQGRAASA